MLLQADTVQLSMHTCSMMPAFEATQVSNFYFQLHPNDANLIMEAHHNEDLLQACILEQSTSDNGSTSMRRELMKALIQKDDDSDEEFLEVQEHAREKELLQGLHDGQSSEELEEELLDERFNEGKATHKQTSHESTHIMDGVMPRPAAFSYSLLSQERKALILKSPLKRDCQFWKVTSTSEAATP